MPQGKLSPNSDRISVIVPKTLKAEADKIAASDGRSLSGWVKKLIIDAVENHNKSDTSE